MRFRFIIIWVIVLEVLCGCTKGLIASNVTNEYDFPLSRTEKCIMCELTGSFVPENEDDTIKIMCLNTWAVGDLRLFEYDELGNDIGYSGAKIMTSDSHGEGECRWTFWSNTGRHTCDITITYGEESILDPHELAMQLCQECLDQIVDTVFDNETTQNKIYHCDVLWDLSTNEIHPISPDVTGYYIQDFWVHIDHHDEYDIDSVYIVYNPE